MTHSRPVPFRTSRIARVLLGLALLAGTGACDRSPVATAACAVLSSAPRPTVLRFTVQSITTGTPPAPVNPTAVRGVIAVAVNVGADAIPMSGARVEVRVGDRVLAAAPVPATGSADLVSLTLTADTGARDAAGERIVPTGVAELTMVLLAGVQAAPACTPVVIGTIPVTLTFANP